MYFFTATINTWKNLLEKDELKLIVIDSLNWFHQNKRAAICGFVIMPNHIHLLWQPLQEHTEENNESAFLSFTAHQFKKHLKSRNPILLNEYLSTQNDREYHFWERRSRTIETLSRKISEQKLDYIHLNPCQEKWKLVEDPVDFKFSSATYYEIQLDEFKFLTHYYQFS